MSKIPVTKKILSSKHRKTNSSFIAVYVLVFLFCFICVAIVPFPVGVIVAAVVLLIAYGVYAKYKSIGGGGSVKKAYFRKRTLTNKESRDIADSDNPGNVYATVNYFCFGDDLVEVTDIHEFKSALVGNEYLVAYYSETDKAFECFDAEKYEVSPDFILRD